MSKNTKKKDVFAGGMSQEVQCLPSKHEALSSNQVPQKEKKPNGKIL
jgi:hypothetical protein